MSTRTHIDDLWVADWPKTYDGAGLPSGVCARLREHGMLLDTCLRQLYVAVEPSDLAAHVDVRAAADGLTLHFGIDAYRYLLEVATGLRSRVPGETNVFGQFKSAWEDHRAHAGAASVARMAPWVHRLINDARMIRREHLDGIGGASYGTLVRRLLSPGKGDRVLFVGAGQLAQSMLPFFDSFDTGGWNRRPICAQRFPADRHFGPQEASDAADWASHVVLTTPADDANDNRWQTLLADSAVGTIVHLGRRRCEWADNRHIRTSFGLEDVFELRRRQADFRSAQLRLAQAACRRSAHDISAEVTGAPLFALA